MSKLLEIFGRAITVDTADLIWHWLTALQERGPLREERIGNEFETIVELLGNRKLDRAQEKLNFHLFEHPDCVFGRMVAAAICLHRNQPQEAIVQLQSVYLRQPSNTMALYTLGFCHERCGHEAEALEFYQDCIKFKGHLQLPRQRMAAIYFKRGRLDKTIIEYEAVVAEHPEDIPSMVLLGHLYIEDRQYEKAIDAFNMAIVSHPDNFHDDSDSEQMDELMGTGQFEQALENVQWLMGRIGPMPDLYVKMADILSRAGRASEAIVHYEKALRIQPNYLEATIKLGTHYLRLHRYALAAEQFNRGVEINDEIVEAYIGLAIAQHLAGQTEETYRTLSLAGAIQQNSTLLFSETATLHLQAALDEHSGISSDEPPDKVVLIEDVIKAHQRQMNMSPRSADAHYKFGILMLVVGDFKRAIEAFENALRINATHHRALSKLALCLCETGQEQQAIERLYRIEHLGSNTMDLHYQTAILYCDKPRFAQAICRLDQQFTGGFTDPDALVNIEVVLENLGLIDRATTTWERLNATANHAIGEQNQG
ncbi:MAG: tetratricopeptide repeat protein [Sedimentisphaerales bacterium]|nr:tetratricopeptide repeat protein [Sedimentisphaerales bacterium]